MKISEFNAVVSEEPSPPHQACQDISSGPNYDVSILELIAIIAALKYELEL